MTQRQARWGRGPLCKASNVLDCFPTAPAMLTMLAGLTVFRRSRSTTTNRRADPRTRAQPSEGVTNAVRASVTRGAACRGPNHNNGSLCASCRISSLPLSIPKRAKLALPGEGVGHNGCEVVE